MSETPFKSGFVAVVGRPNVGKSTLMNALLNQKVAAVSPRPQTTRRRQLGILTVPQGQIIFVDTPGIHNPVHKLGEYMNEVAFEVLQDADLVLWLVEANNRPTPEDQIVAARLAGVLARGPLPVLLAVNKVDLVDPATLLQRLEAYQALCPTAELRPISAAESRGTADLLAAIFSHLPEGPAFYDEDQVTDLYERDIAADLIREACLRNLKDEVPHAVAVRIDEYTERSETTAYIAATLLAEREAHKGILIGEKGAMLKKIGSMARKEIEEMSGRKIFLDLHVKVLANWRDNPSLLKNLGYATEKGSR